MRDSKRALVPPFGKGGLGGIFRLSVRGAVFALLLFWSGHPVPGAPQPAGEPPVPEAAEPPDTFVPSEKLPADAEVAFPVDI